MPYIKLEDRQKVDLLITELYETITDLDYEDRYGVLNYSICRLILNTMIHKEGWSYARLQGIIGLLESAKMEIYRSLIAPYEDKKLQQNGDLLEFSNDR